MTTEVYYRPTKTIGVDSRNTDSSDSPLICNKIEWLKDGRLFLGSGNMFTINLVKQWANHNFSEKHRPDFGVLFTEDKADFAFSCLIISKDGEEVILVDEEMSPLVVLDDIIAIGSGGGYAKAAIMAGATIEEAVNIAIQCDIRSGGPVRIHKI